MKKRKVAKLTKFAATVAAVGLLACIDGRTVRAAESCPVDETAVNGQFLPETEPMTLDNSIGGDNLMADPIEMEETVDDMTGEDTSEAASTQVEDEMPDEASAFADQTNDQEQNDSDMTAHDSDDLLQNEEKEQERQEFFEDSQETESREDIDNCPDEVQMSQDIENQGGKDIEDNAEKRIDDNAVEELENCEASDDACAAQSDDTPNENKNLTPQDYGAKGDGISDDTEAFNNAINAVPDGGTLYVPAGSYRIDACQSIRLRSNMTLKMDPDTKLMAIPNGARGYDIIKLTDLSNIWIYGGQLWGERYNHTGNEGEWGHGIGIYDSSYINIKGVKIYYCWGDGIYLGTQHESDPNAGCSNISIEDCVLSDNRRNNLSIVTGDNVSITNSEFCNANGTDPQVGIDIETNDENAVNEHILIDNCIFSGNQKGSIYIIAPGGGISANDVTIKNSSLDGDFVNLGGTNVVLDHSTVRGETDCQRGIILKNHSSLNDLGDASDVLLVDYSAENKIVAHPFKQDQNNELSVWYAENANSPSGYSFYLQRTTVGTHDAGVYFDLSSLSGGKLGKLIAGRTYQFRYSVRGFGRWGYSSNQTGWYPVLPQQDRYTTGIVTYVAGDADNGQIRFYATGFDSGMWLELSDFQIMDLYHSGLYQQDDGTWAYCENGYIQHDYTDWLNSQNSGWIWDGSDYKYRDIDGSYGASEWKNISSEFYYFDANGNMQTGWLYDAGNWYYLETSGRMDKNKWIDGVYYVKDNGQMARNEWVDHNQYYVDSSGKWDSSKHRVQAGWRKDTGGWWYEEEDQSYPKNQWKLISGNWYFFNGTGYMMTGWLSSNEQWYYLANSGEMLTAQWIDGVYYVKASGEMARNEWVDQDQYYVDENGKWDPKRGKTQGGWKSDTKGKWYQNSDGTYPVNEWKMIDGKWFYFDEHGYMKTGWIYVDGQWYFLNSEGIMCTNQWIDNTYYVKNSGEMARNEWVDQNRYYVDENGEWVRNYA